MKTRHIFPILVLLPWLARSATYTVINTNDTGAGSLRQAIVDANANAGADTIAFSITNLAFTISPASALPNLTEAVTIDGSTQPGFSTAPIVELSGANAGANVNGFKIAAGNCVIRALAINRFKNDGIQITNGVGSRVEGCYLGVAPDGFTRRGNGAAGVRIAGVNSGVQTTGTNVIGGEAAAAHNLISANLYGIWLSETTDNLILGNIIGADATGTFDVGNTNMGIFCYYLADLNVIGGTNAGARNLISGNGEAPALYLGDGIRLDSSSSNAIFGNYIGVNAAGTAAIPNGEHGVNIQYGLFNLVGGAASGQGNLISGNLVHGVNLGGYGEGESILNYAGTPPPLPDGNVIQGNLIGPEVTGQSAIPNQSDGVFIGNMQGNLVGGYLAGERNVISGNLHHGVEITSSNTQSNQVAGNFIGLTLTDALPLGNGYDGVYVNANFNAVGGTNAGAGNRIAYNGNNGVEIGYRTGNLILGNSIYANTNLGIDLGGDYVTFNDAGDGDTGANNFQNYPVLSRAVTNAAQTIITASLNSGSSLTYRVELFDNPTNNPSGYGEGRTYLGFTSVTTDGGGNVSFTFTNPAALPLGHFITATATDPDGNTSEFSFVRKVVSANTLDLAVTLAESADPVPHFTNFTYTVTVTNYGPTNATAVFVTNTLSSGLTFVSAVPTQGSAAQSAGVVVWNVGALADGVGASLVIMVHGNVTALESNSVVAVAAQVENDYANNSAVETTAIGIADLGMSFTDSPDPVVAGQPLTYTLTVTNLGPDAASGAVANFFLDGSQVFTGASVSQGSFAQYGNFIQATFNSINAHAIATLTVTAIPTAVGTNFSNGNLSRLEFDPDTANDSDFEETVVQAGPGILEFTLENYFVSEGGGSAVIGVQRLGGAVGTVGASFATSNLTATAGSDYTATNGALVFTNGETLKSFRVFITDDLAAECNETLALRLFSATGGAILLPPTNSTLEIFENETMSVGTIKAVSLALTNLVTTGNQGSYGMSISDDGRYAAFHSYANNLVPTTDQNGSPDIFIHDRVTHSNTLVSLNAQGAASAGGSYQAQLSADGLRVGFLGNGPDLTTNAATLQQIYVRTLASGVNQLVSVSTNGAGGNNDSYTFSLSTNGAKVAFHSGANNLVAYVADTNGFRDVFFRDLATGTNILVSVNSAGTASGNDYSDRPVISADGRYVVFGSYASNLSPSDSNTRFDIYRRDVVNGTTALVSANTGGTAGNGNCEFPYAVSADGRYVTFQSTSTDLAAGTPSFTRQTFQRDMIAGTNVIVSKNNSGVAANGYTYLYGASRDGRYVLFDTYASNLATNDNNFSSDVFVRDVVGGTTYLVSVNRDTNGPGDSYSVASAISPDGRYVTFTSSATNLVAASSPAFTYELYQRDLLNATTTLLSTRFGDTNGANSSINDSAVCSNGVAVFTSYATDIAPLDANGGGLDAFARAPGDTNATLLSYALGVTGSAYSQQNVMNGAGTKAAFSSYAANLVAGDNNFDQDIFLADLTSGTTTLVSVNAAGTGSATGYSENPSLSEEGRYVVYQSGAQDIVGNDANGFTDVYLRDTVAGTNALVSINSAGNGAGNDTSVNGRITPDGRFIVFESRASNLVSNDLNGSSSDIFIRTRTNGLTQLISLNAAGTASANSDSYNPRISPDGRYVVYETFSSNLGPADSNNHFDVYARDRQTGSNILCSPNLAGSNGGNADSFQAVISGDGSTVIFYSYATDLVAGATNGMGDVFAFNLATRTMKFVSAAPGGVAGSGSAYGGSVSTNGRYVAFQSDSINLVTTPDVNGHFSDVFVRDLATDTTTLVSLNCHGTGTGNDASYDSQISADGRYVVFNGAASDLVPGIFFQYVPNVFRHDRQTGTTLLISANRFATGSGNSSSYSALVSADGGVVSFLSDASDLVASDANHTLDVFAWNSGLVVTGVNLTLTKTASTNLTSAFNNFTYTLAVTNHGTVTATGVSVTDILPAGLTFVSASTTQGTVTNSGGTVTAAVGSLNVNAGARVTLIVTPTAAGSRTNSATATANESDTAPADNTSSVIVTVTPLQSPLLSVGLNGSQLAVLWPVSTPDVFHLENATNLNPVIVWTTVTNAVSTNGGFRGVTIPLNLFDPERYFRLRQN